MATLSATAALARDALERPGPLTGAETRVPALADLYAIYGDTKTWKDLSLGKPPDGRPL